MLKFQKLIPGDELAIAPNYQRIYVFLEFDYLKKSPRAAPDFQFEPFLSIELRAIAGLTSLDMITRTWTNHHPCHRSIQIHLNHEPSSDIRVRARVYQGISRYEERFEFTSLAHHLNLPDFATKPIIDILLEHQPNFKAYECDQGAILSYDIPIASTPKSSKIPEYETKTFNPITKNYTDVQPLHLHLFDPPRHDIPPEKRTLQNSLNLTRWFLDYPVLSYALTW